MADVSKQCQGEISQAIPIKERGSQSLLEDGIEAYPLPGFPFQAPRSRVVRLVSGGNCGRIRLETVFIHVRSMTASCLRT